MEPIINIGRQLGLQECHLNPYGHYMAKVDCWHEDMPIYSNEGNLILVTSINPTKAGEGKTVTSIGLNDAINRLGYKSTLCLREPSLGPYFGMKGGATGGGYSQAQPAEDINLHFTGDLHAITSAHNLLTSIIDNIIYYGNSLNIDPEYIEWGRVLDLNDRSLRHLVTGLGGKQNGTIRESGFEITAASEIMAIVALASNYDDLIERLSNIFIGRSLTGAKYLYAGATESIQAMARILKDTIKPNLVQSLESNPIFMHAGPFANIAHGCNSVIATRTALSLSDYVVTEAGFGSDLGAEKFFNIKCRQANLKPKASVCVVTLRALRSHGGLSDDHLYQPNYDAVKEGLKNLGAHLDNLKQYNLPVIVAINYMAGDTRDEIDCVQAYCRERGIEAVVADHWANGGEGAVELAETVVKAVEQNTKPFQLLYADELPVVEKIRTIAQKVYQAEDIALSPKAKKQIQSLEQEGWGSLPVCIAKTQYSLSSNPKAKGVPKGHTLEVREVRLSSGAGFIVVLCGNIIRMPGMPRTPAAVKMDRFQ